MSRGGVPPHNQVARRPIRGPREFTALPLNSWGRSGRPLPLDISEIQGPLRVLAGPGTGKTHALVDLYAQAVQGGVAGRDQILVLTFSTGAAGEISRRIDERLRTRIW